MKKRILALLTAATMLLAGCGAQSAAKDSTAADRCAGLVPECAPCVPV